MEKNFWEEKSIELKEKIAMEKALIEKNKKEIEYFDSELNKTKHSTISFCTKTTNESFTALKTGLLGLLGALALLAKAKSKK